MSGRYRLQGAGLLLASSLLLTTGCGKKGPLIYPDMLIAQPPQQLLVEQTGTSLRISFDLPAKDLSGRKLEDLEALLIARRTYQGAGCVSCQDQFQEVQKIDFAFPRSIQRQGNRIVWIDTDVRSGERYQYRLKTVQAGGIIGTAVVTALVKVLPPPSSPLLKADAVFGGMIVIDLNGAPPQDATLVGYTLYRAEGASPLQLLATLQHGVHSYDDQAVQHGVVYRYVARMLVKRADGMIAESEPSQAVSISVTDELK